MAQTSKLSSADVQTDRTFVRRSPMPASAREVFDWHEREGALERLTPPWSPVTVEERRGGIETGARVVLRMPLGPLSMRWVAEHTDYVRGHLFRDVQVEGPFARWEHTHSFLEDGDLEGTTPLPDPPPAAGGGRSEAGGRARDSILEDRVVYRLPGGALGAAVGGLFVPDMLERMFAYRHRITAGDIQAHARWTTHARQHFAITGASGLVGRALGPYLTTGGHRVTAIARGEQAHTFRLPDEECSAVVHLAGEPIAASRWNAETKSRIHDSRAYGTRALCEQLARRRHKPRVLVAASATGFYGDRGAEPVDESSSPGDGFLPEVCRAWEAATEPARAAGIRVVHLRIGIVLTPAGGALRQLLTPVQLGLGGRLGSGRQYMSWIGLDDLLDVILHASMDDSIEGSVNAVSPQPISNAEFVATLARVLHRPALLPVPAAAMRALVGEMADALLLASTRVLPTRLAAARFSFRTPTLDAALRHTLGRV